VPNKATQQRQAEVAATGIVPLDVMLKRMRHHHRLAEVEAAKGEQANQAMIAAALEQAHAAAKDAAPYVHPRLAAMEHTGRGGGPIRIADLRNASDEQLAALESLFGPLAAAGGDTEGDPGGESPA